MYRVLVNECAAQFRRFSYDIAHLVGVCDHYPDGTDCPLCVTVSEINAYSIYWNIMMKFGGFAVTQKK